MIVKAGQAAGAVGREHPMTTVFKLGKMTTPVMLGIDACTV